MNQEEYWESLSKPWTKEQCETRYVESRKISISKLSKLSGRPIGTLNDWSSGANGKTWAEARDEYEARLKKETREKTIEKTSDRLSSELSILETEHFQAYKICRQIAVLRAEAILKKLQRVLGSDIAAHPEVNNELAQEFKEVVQDRETQKIDVMVLNLLNLVIDRSVRGERMSVGLEYENINKAIATVEECGLQVVVKDDKVLTQLVMGQAFQEDRD